MVAGRMLWLNVKKGDKMNNLPTTFEGLLALLYNLRDEATAPYLAYLGRMDYDLLADKVDSLLDQYSMLKEGMGE